MHTLARCLPLVLLSACAASDDGSDPADSGVPGDPIGQAGLDDEFDDASTLANWRVSGDSGRSVLDIDTTNDGKLTLQPKPGGWYGDRQGPFVYRMVSGDFLVEIEVTAGKIGNPDVPPDEQFNSAGMLARDPGGGPGNENWIMVNTGRQLGAQVASEGKTTVDSQSTLELRDGAHRGRLRMCRIGSVFVLSRQLDGESELSQIARFDRPDLPEDLQVGLVVNGWNSDGTEPDTSRMPDLEATYEYVRASEIAAEADCMTP